MEMPGHDLIVTIVRKGWADRVVNASKSAGAEGGTIVPARGTGIHEQARLFNIPIEPEKEIVLTVIREDLTAKVLDTIICACRLDQPATGIAFVISLKQVAGIVHLVTKCTCPDEADS